MKESACKANVFWSVAHSFLSSESFIISPFACQGLKQAATFMLALRQSTVNHHHLFPWQGENYFAWSSTYPTFAVCKSGASQATFTACMLLHTPQCSHVVFCKPSYTSTGSGKASAGEDAISFPSGSEAGT